MFCAFCKVNSVSNIGGFPVSLQIPKVLSHTDYYQYWTAKPTKSQLIAASFE